MADPMNPDIPPEMQAQYLQLQRRRQLAEAMLAQSQKQQPIQSWTQGAAQLANAYLGKKKLDEADKQAQDLSQQYQTGQNAAMDQVKTAMAPQPAITLPEGQDGPTRPEMPASQEKVRQALIQAQMSSYPQVRQFGAAQQKYVEADQARQDQQQARMDALQQQAQDRANQITLAAEQGRISKAEADARHAELMIQLKQMGSGKNGTPYFTPVYTKDGVISFDARTGSAQPLIVDGKQAVRANDDPSLQGQIAGAKTGAQATAKRDFNMQGLTSVIDSAEQLLKSKDKPTHSGVGALVDTAGAIVGVSPKGAAEADQLRAIGGALTAKMPRMEGPQSDKDVALYREMAGQVGNASLPVERRLAALQQVKGLWQKYEKSQPVSTGGAKFLGFE